MHDRARTKLLVACLTIAMANASCYRYAARTMNVQGNPHPSPATEPRQEVVWNYFWGAVQGELHATDCLGNGLSQATVRTNLGWSLLGLLTLGMVAPMSVEYQCARDRVDAGGGFLNPPPSNAEPGDGGAP